MASDKKRAADSIRIEEIAGRTQRGRTVRRFMRNRAAVAGMIFMLIVVPMVFPLAAVVAPQDPHTTNLKEVGKPPSVDHLLGTDLTGRDMWSRVVYGGRVSLAVGLVAVAIYMSIGIVLGSLAGFYGGIVDSIIMRVTETVMSIPGYVMLITIVAFIGPGLLNSMFAIGLLGWTGIARLVRGQVLSIRAQDYVMAARATGVPAKGIILRHVLPNTMAPIIVAASFGVAGAILLEAGLSFLGLGVQIPVPSWGQMINEARSPAIIQDYLWLWVPPGLAITLCVLSINFIGDGLRDAADPYADL
jgi:peptide/nickel transport system permease protein